MEVNKLDMKLSRVTSQKKKEVATRYRADYIDNTVMHCAKLQNFMHNMHRALAGADEQASVFHSTFYLLIEPQGLLRGRVICSWYGPQSIFFIECARWLFFADT